VEKMDRKKLLAIAAVVLLFITTITLYSLKEDQPFDLRMTIFGKRSQEVDYGESATYTISVKNVGEESKNVHLQITDVPDHWAASLDAEDVSLSGNERTSVTLTVTAPSIEIAQTRGMTRVAEIGVRAAGNVTIGTITILKGTANVTRDGITLPLANNNDILSGDVITTKGSANITLDMKKLVNDSLEYQGVISILLDDANVSFLYKGDTVYMSVAEGTVTVHAKSEGGGGRATTAHAPVVNLSTMHLINAEFPRRDYRAVLIFDANLSSSLFTMHVSPDNTTIEVFHGEIEVKNEVDNKTLSSYEQLSGVRTESFLGVQPVERMLVILDFNGAVEGTMEIEGTNVFERDDVHHFSVEGTQYFITPRFPEITLKLMGRTKGEYTIYFTQISGYTNKTFAVRSTTTIETKDSFVYGRESLKLFDMEQGKVYDLVISYETVNPDYSTAFVVENVKTSTGDQTFVVLEWEKLGDENAEPVMMKQGGQEKKLHTGMTGDEIEERFDVEDKGKSLLVPAIGGIVLIVVIVIGLLVYFGYLPLGSEDEKGKKGEKKHQEPGDSKEENNREE